MNTPSASVSRILELDALRGLAALGVVVYHYGAHFSSRPFGGILSPFYNAGFLLVDFFFVLSGYVIARAYWRESRQWNLRRNLWARLARLYPLHLVTLLATVALLATVPAGAPYSDSFRLETNDIRHFLLNLLMLNQVGLQESWSFNTPAWSISTEFVVNVAFLIFIACRAAGRLALAGSGLAALAAMYALNPGPYVSGNLILGFIDTNLARCMLGFGGGVSVYWILHRLAAAPWLAARPNSSSILGVASVVALTCLMLASGRDPPIWHYIASISIAMSCVLFVPFGPISKALLNRKTLVYLGDISYSTYLVHYPLLMAFCSISANYLELDFSSPAAFGAFLAVVIAVSAITHRYLEMPAQRSLLALSDKRKLPALT